MTNVYIVHGYQANSNSHWFQWLKSSLELEGHDVTVLDLPHSDQPILSEWLAYMKHHITEVNSETIFVAHSLGVITVLRYLEQLPQNNIGKLAIVSGFNEKINSLSMLDEFIDENIDYSHLKERFNQIFAIAAKDDPIVPFELTKALCEKLDGKFYELEEGGHFCEEDGFDSFLFLKKKVIINFD
ncbi:serine hydrolase family protein [Staphylococcus felis]|uniref:Serine hydrolase family protein n=1 Tax=Staphylococcus felis TaxID=46127 RepID=A0AAX1RUU2_9STAP|nr:alpha/beta hydrolase [Staphylococcus felis]REH79266.1 serine hydrolase family protein [Staphylococcus felis]REH82163.1 serine hydrolase family protein [Staphylococcus felis]REH84265.1 serine hydrolase family protein [Staphylococcus felis]REH99646.1 serine hydrolase family protein [Staphylococcus felis]REI17298.1 serine hydrolase family protein [Staphylococcus felis]